MAAPRSHSSSIATFEENDITNFKDICAIPNTTQLVVWAEVWRKKGDSYNILNVLYLLNAKSAELCEREGEFVFPQKTTIRKILVIPSGKIYCGTNDEITIVLTWDEPKKAFIEIEKLPVYLGSDSFLIGRGRYAGYIGCGKDQWIKVKLKPEEYEYFENACEDRPFTEVQYWKSLFKFRDMKTGVIHEIPNPTDIPLECSLHDFDSKVPILKRAHAAPIEDGSVAVFTDDTMTIYSCSDEEKSIQTTGVRHQLDFLKQMERIVCVAKSSDELLIGGVDVPPVPKRDAWNMVSSETGHSAPDHLTKLYAYNIKLRMSRVLPVSEPIPINPIFTPDRKIVYDTGWRSVHGIDLETGEKIPCDTALGSGNITLGMTSHGILAVGCEGKLSVHSTPYSLMKKALAEREANPNALFTMPRASATPRLPTAAAAPAAPSPKAS